MRDLDGNLITLSETPNPNVVVWGSSGQGKTYFFCREIERAVRENKHVLIIDYSGSYTKEELEKNKFPVEKTEEFNLAKNPFYWFSHHETEQEFTANLADALIAVWRVESYFQKKWLRRVISLQMQNTNKFHIKGLVDALEILYNSLRREEGGKDDLENINRLLARLAPLETLDKFFVQRGKKEKRRIPVSVIQLSDFSDSERNFLAGFLMELFWEEVKQGNNIQNVLVLDEIQFLMRNKGKAFQSIMREGRKFGIKAYLGTQFISSCKEEEIESLMQAGNILVFRPTPRDLRFSARAIDFSNEKEWKNILSRLDVGEAVLAGNFYINARTQKISDKIVCKI